MTALYRTRVAHHRGTPLRHSFRHSSTAWLVDLARLGGRTTPPDLPRWLRPVVQFRASDHLGDPESRWYDNVLAFADTQGVDLSGQQVLALTTPRSLGHAFNPITVYWCLDGEHLTCAIAEVHNTYGERHAYLVRPDQRSYDLTDLALRYLRRELGTAAPAAAASSMRAWMSACAPTSTPCVGSSSRRTRGWRRSHRASITFC